MRAWLEKDNGKKRPIGKPTFEDKVVQRVVVMLLEPIYEQVFHDFSHGFRRGRSLKRSENYVKNQHSNIPPFHCSMYEAETQISKKVRYSSRRGGIQIPRRSVTCKHDYRAKPFYLRAFLSTFPTGVRGNFSINSIILGTL